MSLPLMRKTFIEAQATPGAPQRRCRRLFRLCGRLSLRPGGARRFQQAHARSLPLMRKTFIEATGLCDTQVERGESLPLMRKTFIEAILPPTPTTPC